MNLWNTRSGTDRSPDGEYMKINHTWYCKPCGIRERLTAGGVVVRRTPAGLMIALAREVNIDGWVLPKGGVEPEEDIDAAARREIEEEVGLSKLTRRGDLAVLERLESERKFWSIIHYALYETGQTPGLPPKFCCRSGLRGTEVKKGQLSG